MSDTGSGRDEGMRQETDNEGAAMPTDSPLGAHPTEPAEGGRDGSDDSSDEG